MADRAMIVCAGIAIIVILCIFLAGPATLAYFFIDIGEEYANHKCNDPVDPFDLAYWLKLEGIFWMSSIAYLITSAILRPEWLLSSWKLWALFGIFSAAWTIIGMVELARAGDCHVNASELWNWAFAAVLINCVFNTGLIFGGGCAAGGKKAS